MHPRYLGMARQVFGDQPGVVVRASHPDLERFERAHQHPTRIWIKLRANGTAPGHHLLDEAGVAADAAADEIAMAADILGQGTQRDVSAAFQRCLKHRAQHRIVNDDRGSIPLKLGQVVGDRRARGEINKAVGRIGWRLDQDQTDPALRARRLRRLTHIRGIDAVGKAKSGDTEGAHLLLQQRFGAAIERATVQYRVAGPKKGE